MIENNPMVDALQAARLYNLARGRGGDNESEDIAALAELLQQFAEAGMAKAITPKEGTLDAALQELTQHYPLHRTVPGIQLAYLADKQVYYCAVHIFPGAGPESRQVYAKATHKDLSVALGKMIAVWRDRASKEG